jgi:hypothetical protein
LARNEGHSKRQGLQKITDQLNDNRNDSDEDEQRPSFFDSLLLNPPQTPQLTLPEKGSVLNIVHFSGAKLLLRETIQEITCNDDRPQVRRPAIQQNSVLRYFLASQPPPLSSYTLAFPRC